MIDMMTDTEYYTEVQRSVLKATTKAKDKVEGGLLLNVVIGQCTSILQLFSSENQPLLVGRDTLLVLDFSLHVVNSV